MSTINDLIDEQRQLASARSNWEVYWRQVSNWVLPQTEEFNSLVNTGGSQPVMSVVNTPVAAQRSKHIYDMTSLWAIDRLTSGLISLKTPESDYWHDLTVDDDFGYKPSQAETVALEATRNYQFKIRANPKSGFWPAHKAAVKSMCAFGDGWLFIEELNGVRVPWLYQYMQLPELFPAVGPDGQPNRMFRVFSWSALQIATKWPETCGEKVKEMANDPKKRHERVRVMHAVRPRNEEFRNRMGLRGAEFASWYCLPDDKHVIGEGGFWEFPFTRYAWSNVGQRPFSEGPVAYAIAQIQSLNELVKNQLIGSQQAGRPALATAGKNFTRVNLNPGAVNPGLITGDGKALFAPITGGQRLDLSQAVIEAERQAVRENLYLNLWQILIADAGGEPETATQSMLKAQEKGEMLGPVGISLNDGLSHNSDREIGIMARKGAFRDGSPLAVPSLAGREVAPAFTSPLDRLRQVGQIIGAQRTYEIAVALEQARPGTLARVDADEMLELAQRTYGAPAALLKDRKVAEQAAETSAQALSTAANLEATRQGGEAVRAVGEGATAASTGIAAINQNPQARDMIRQLAARAPALQQAA